jgi:hypothetical protein
MVGILSGCLRKMQQNVKAPTGGHCGMKQETNRWHGLPLQKIDNLTQHENTI